MLNFGELRKLSKLDLGLTECSTDLEINFGNSAQSLKQLSILGGYMDLKLPDREQDFSKLEELSIEQIEPNLISRILKNSNCLKRLSVTL